MKEELHQQLRQEIEQIRGLLSQRSTESIAGFCLNAIWMDPFACSREYGLFSPYVQCLFLLGLMASTAEPRGKILLTDKEWHQTCQRVNAAYRTYETMCVQNWAMLDPAAKKLSGDKFYITSSCLLDYFNTGPLCTCEQIIDRITETLAPFDEEFEARLGLSASQALEVTGWVHAHLQGKLDAVAEIIPDVKQAQRSFDRRCENQQWSLEQAQKEVWKDPSCEMSLDLWQRVQGIQKLDIEDIERRWGAGLARAYWSTFALRRGHEPEILYPTQRNVAHEKPVIEIRKGEAFCLVINTFYLRLLGHYRRCLLETPRRERFLRKRDTYLEDRVKAIVCQLCGDEVGFFSNVSEFSEGAFEHDLVVVLEHDVLVFESKASTPREPLRNPDKSFDRLKRDFEPIQSAFDQARRIRSRILNGEEVPLYDKNGAEVVRLRSNKVKRVFCICVTLERFGVLAVELTYMLRKNKTDEYPWVVNLYDLETLFEGFEHRGWGAKKLTLFLRERIQLYGKAAAWDELDIGGIFLQHGTLEDIIRKKADKVFMAPGNASVFDDIYFEKKGIGKADFTPTDGPFFFDPGSTNNSHPRTSFSQRASMTKVGRNQPCPCGSGRKYKKCCGRDSSAST